MNKLICKICNQEVLQKKHFWMEHRVSEAQYFTENYPRFSKATGEPIKFKNREFYLSSDFNDKREMAKWFKDNPDKAESYSYYLLCKRREMKGITYAPSQVELRSLMMPSMIWFKKNGTNYNELCLKAGLLTRFDSEDEKIQYGDIRQEATIIIDSREQLPFSFPGYKTIVKKLNYGDYALDPNRFKVHIERKSLQDFVGTMSQKGYDRFENSAYRCKRDRAYMVVLVESSLNDALRFDYLPHMKYAKIGPDFIFHNVRNLIQKYPNLQFLFCKNKKEATEATLKIFSMKKHPKHFDLQAHYDISGL